MEIFKMKVILFAILVYTAVEADDSVSKYIDLLPKEEKDVFLEKVARRILAEVPISDNKPNTSVELLDDQLKQHDDFVNKILEEEAHNLRQGAPSNDTHPKEEKKPGARTYIDLTLRTEHRHKRESNRRVFTGYSPDNYNSSESGDESDIKEDIQVKNFRKSKESVINEQIKNGETAWLGTETTVQATNDDEDNTKTAQDLHVTVESVIIDTGKDFVNDNNHISMNNTTSVDDKDNASESNENPYLEANNFNASNINITSTETPLNSNNNKNDAVKKLEDSKILYLEITSTTESAENADTEFPFTTKTNDIIISTTKADADINQSSDITTAKVEATATTSSSVKITNEVKINEQPYQSPNIEIQNNSNKRKDLKVNGKKTSKNNKDLDNLLRLKQNKNKQAGYMKGLQNEYEKNQKKVYKVYEISPDESPFVKVTPSKAKPKPKPTTEPSVEEQPFYVPIYNYAPNNAFFNPYNLFGPNDESDIEKQGYAINDDENNGFISEKVENLARMEDNDKSRSKKNIEWDLYDDPLLRKLKLLNLINTKPRKARPYENNQPAVDENPSLTNEHSPNDYFDMGYYSGQANKEALTRARHQKDCETSAETQEPPPKFKENIDWIRFIRKLLLEKKVFSFIHPIQIKSTPDPDFSKYGVTEDPNKKEGKRMNQERKQKTNIAVDYYYRSRADDTERVERAKVYNKSDFNSPLLSYEIVNNSTDEKFPIFERHTLRDAGSNTDYKLMKDLLNLIPPADVMPTLNKLIKMNLQKKSKRSRGYDEIDMMVVVLRDMVKSNNRALVQYNWLETTVDLLSAAKKITDMIDAYHNGGSIHPADFELLKYIIHLHAKAKEEFLQDRNKSIPKGLRAFMLPRNKKRKPNFIKEKGLLHRVWLVRMTEEDLVIPDEDLRDFEEFLDDLKEAMFDLHTALKYISMVTKFNNQKWFENLKQVHIGMNRKQLLEIILHLHTSRVLGLVEESARNGLEENYKAYINKNEKEYNRTKGEFVFLLHLLDEIEDLK